MDNTITSDKSFRNYFQSISPKFITWEFYKKYIDKEPPFGTIGSVVFLRTYSHYIAELGRREYWCEVVLRCVEFSLSLESNTLFPEQRREAETLFDLWFNLEAFPAGRTLWVGHPKKDLKEANFNCSFRVIDGFEAYQEMCHLLMLGVGVGFSVEEKYTKNIPYVFPFKKVVHLPYTYNPNTDNTIVYCNGSPSLDFREDIMRSQTVTINIGDSRKGWEDALLYYLYCFSSNSLEMITINYDSVRPYGTRLKTMGGRASGYEPLKLLFQKINWIVNKTICNEFSSVDLVDIATCLAEAIVVGGVRRSSLIALGDKDDQNFIEMKSNLWADTNSDLFKAKLKVLESLNSHLWDTEGYQNNQCIRETINFIDFSCPKYRWRTSRVMSNNSIMLNEFEEENMTVIFDSILSNGEPGFINQKAALSKRPLFKGVNPCFSGDMRLLTSEGYLTFEELENTHPLIFNKNYNYTKGKVWCSGVKDTIRLILSNGSEIVCTPDHIIMTADHKEVQAKDSLNEKLMTLAYPLNMTVIKILPNKPVKVYDFTEPETHWGFVENVLVHNCAEILLDNQGVCNLVEVNVLAFVEESKFGYFLNSYKLSEALIYSTKHCSRITEIDFWHDDWNRVQKRDRLLGVSLTGVVEAFNKLNYSSEEIEEFYTNCKEVVNKTADYYHRFLGIPEALLTTCVKPSGTLSNLPGVSSGIHAPYAPYYIRRVRVSANDPIAKALRFLGVPVVPENGYKDLESSPIWVFSFYVKTNAVINSNKESALVQLKRYKQVMDNYVEHNCFSGDTKFITKKGVFRFDSFSSGDKVEVINGNREWSTATVIKKTNKEPLLELTLTNVSDKNNTHPVTIKATPNHRWLARTGVGKKDKVLQTSDLKLGYKIQSNFLNNSNLLLSEEGIRHGIVFGDGSLTSKKTRTQLYLVKDKRELKFYFKEFGSVTERDDLDQTRVYGLPKHYKVLPKEENLTEEYIAGFIAGLIATDGNVCKNITTISSSKIEVIEWLEKYSPVIGLSVSKVNSYERVGFGKSSLLYELCYRRPSIPNCLIIRKHHKDNLSDPSFSKKWRVIGIKALESEEVWCVEEPVTNKFTLEHNILTFNCSITVSFKPEEVPDIISWLRNNFDSFVGVSFLPSYEGVYPNLPYEAISEEEYLKGVSSQKVFNEKELNTLISYYETEEKEYMLESDCSSGSCPVR